MNRTFLLLLVGAVVGSWIGSSERLLHLLPLMVYGGATPEEARLRELFDVLPVAGAFLGAALSLVLGARRAAVAGVMGLALGPLFAVLDQPSLAFYAAALTRRIFDVTLLTLVASLVAKQKEHRLAALLAFLVCRHAAIELGLNAWIVLGLGGLWARNPRGTEAVCLAFSLGVAVLVWSALRRTRESVVRPSLLSPYRASAHRDAELAPHGGFPAALPFALGTGVFVVLVTLLGSRFSLRFEPSLGASLAAIAFGAFALIGAHGAGLRSLPGGLLCVVADLALIVAVARTAVTDRGGVMAVLAVVPAMEAFASMTSDVTLSLGYALSLALAAVASITVPRRIHAKLPA